MGMNSVVASLLRDAGMRDVFTVAVGAAMAPNPTVVLEGDYKRDGEYTHGERGTFECRVLCVRETMQEADEAAHAAEEALLYGEWERYREACCGDICGIDVGVPRCRGRDRSGRYVYGLDVEIAIARDDG